MINNVKLSNNNKYILIYNKKYDIVLKNNKRGSNMNNNKMINFTKIFLDLMFYTGILTCLSLPWTMKFFGTYFPLYQQFHIQMIIIFEAAGVAGLIIVKELRKIFKTVIDKNCFVDENVRSLKTMGISAFVIVTLMLSRLFFVLTPSILVLVLVFLLAGMFSFVLSQVFKVAINYKAENELTI